MSERNDDAHAMAEFLAAFAADESDGKIRPLDAYVDESSPHRESIARCYRAVWGPVVC